MASKALLRIGVVLPSLAAAALLTACAKHPAGAAPAPWSFSQRADGPDLSAKPVESAKDFAPTLHIICHHGRPNVELDPVFITYSCGADCASGGKVGFDETFMAVTDPAARFAEAAPKGGSAPLSQDLLSNAPADVVVTGDAKAGVSQGGEWIKTSGSNAITRFDYGSSNADAAYVTSVDKQARNFINRLAGSPWFRVGQGGSDARFDTRGLAAALPKVWAVCAAK